jgi:hypothetical protein
MIGFDDGDFVYCVGLDGTHTTVEIHHDWFLGGIGVNPIYVDGKVD